MVDARLALLTYFVLLLLTRTVDQGDTSVYADSLVGAIRGTRGSLWEFGHALWRPLAFSVWSHSSTRTGALH